MHRRLGSLDAAFPSGSDDNAPPGSENLSEPHDIVMSTPNTDPKGASSGGRTCSVAEFLHLHTVVQNDYTTLATNSSIPQDRYTEDFANAAIFHPFAFGFRSHPYFSFKLQVLHISDLQVFN